MSEQHECKCAKEDVIINLQKDNEEFHHFFFGNGKPGFLRDMTELSIHVKAINEDMPELKKQLHELIVFKSIEMDKKASKSVLWQRGLIGLGIFFSVLFSTLGYLKSSSNAIERANTVVTSPAAIEKATDEGKNFKIPAKEMKKQKNQSYQEEIESINKD